MIPKAQSGTFTAIAQRDAVVDAFGEGLLRPGIAIEAALAGFRLCENPEVQAIIDLLSD